MKRNEFKRIIKIMSFWRVDRRRGNYRLPSGDKLSDYLLGEVLRFLDRNNLAIDSRGDVHEVISGAIFVPFADSEELNEEQQEARARAIVREMIGG